jgi:hypothetical protein
MAAWRKCRRSLALRADAACIVPEKREEIAIEAA